MNKEIGNLNLLNFLQDLENSGFHRTSLSSFVDFSFQPLLPDIESGGEWLDSKNYIVGFVVNDESKFHTLLEIAIKHEEKSLCEIQYPPDGEKFTDRIAIDFLVQK